MFRCYAVSNNLNEKKSKIEKKILIRSHFGSTCAIWILYCQWHIEFVYTFILYNISLGLFFLIDNLMCFSTSSFQAGGKEEINGCDERICMKKMQWTGKDGR